MSVLPAFKLWMKSFGWMEHNQNIGLDDPDVFGRSCSPKGFAQGPSEN
jgi:hypothetical protein